MQTFKHLQDMTKKSSDRPHHTTPCKYIYVARNPKDVAVSLYFQMKSAYIPGIEWDDYWRKFMGWQRPGYVP